MEGLWGHVHHLATRYGWTESEILRLPTERRNYYVDKINDDIRRENKGK